MAGKPRYRGVWLPADLGDPGAGWNGDVLTVAGRDLIDFGITPPIARAVAIVALFPIILAVAARVTPWRNRNALQFLVAATGTLLLWVASVSLGPEVATPLDIGVTFMIVAAAVIVYLEAWALLSRGYTLGLILTLFRSGTELQKCELAARYRGGEGLGWIMSHRLAGLTGARLVRLENDVVRLTPLLGVGIASLCAAAVKALRLRRTG
jgi:hypothetical protein